MHVVKRRRKGCFFFLDKYRIVRGGPFSNSSTSTPGCNDKTTKEGFWGYLKCLELQNKEVVFKCSKT